MAEQYGVYTRATDDHDEDLKHGTFVIDQSGRIVWGSAGDRPFVDNQFLLSLIEQEVSPQRHKDTKSNSIK